MWLLWLTCDFCDLHVTSVTSVTYMWLLWLTCNFCDLCLHHIKFIPSQLKKGEGLPQQAEVAQEVPGRLRPRTFLTFGTTRVVGRQPHTPTAFTPGEIPGTHFLEAELTPGHIFLSVATEKSSVTSSGIDLDTLRLVAQCLNYYATPGLHSQLVPTNTEKK
jgi:hypothetical protein